MCIKQFHQLSEVGQRSRQAIDLVDDNNIKLPRADIVQQSLQVGTIGGPAGITTVIISRPDHGPAGMGLALDVGGSGIVLSIQRIELLVESVFRGDAGVDGTAGRADRRSLYDRAFASNRASLSLKPKKRGPVHLVALIAEAALEELALGLA